MNKLLKGDKVIVHIKDMQGKDIPIKCADTVFEVVEKNGKLGINYMAESTSVTRILYDKDGFVPFESFCNTEFEKVG